MTKSFLLKTLLLFLITKSFYNPPVVPNLEARQAHNDLRIRGVKVDWTII